MSHHLFFTEELFVDYGLTVNTRTVPATYVPGTHSLPCLYRYKLITFRLHKYAGKINSFYRKYHRIFFVEASKVELRSCRNKVLVVHSSPVRYHTVCINKLFILYVLWMFRAHIAIITTFARQLPGRRRFGLLNRLRKKIGTAAAAFPQSPSCVSPDPGVEPSRGSWPEEWKNASSGEHLSHLSNVKIHDVATHSSTFCFFGW